MYVKVRRKTNKRSNLAKKTNNQRKLAIRADEMRSISNKVQSTTLIEPYLKLIRRAAKEGNEGVFLDVKYNPIDEVNAIATQLKRLGYSVEYGKRELTRSEKIGLYEKTVELEVYW